MVVWPTIPFSAAKLATLYPSHAQFVAEWASATLVNEAQGLVTSADGAQLVTAAAESGVGG